MAGAYSVTQRGRIQYYKKDEYLLNREIEKGEGERVANELFKESLNHLVPVLNYGDNCIGFY